ncbi:MAG TPA: FAD-binding oxidoreductase [Dongiaceae bacterium]|jgi:FAD/FMN-containing dehydrogenase|nr:FAD-binding oxidoreductase [Dongiaceae bacterium]
MDSATLAQDLARAQFDGTLITDSHVQYDRLRRVNNGLIDRRPAAIVRATSKKDVQTVVRIAAERDALLAVRCGGHSFPGLSTCDGGIVLDLALMKEVMVDPEARTAEVGGGALLGDVDTAGLAYGLVTPAGVVSHTGVGGLTLGGGMGWLSRRFGMTVDNLLGVDIVMADGRLLRINADKEPDLFWAIRGGGGNFGVVTKFWFRMHALGPTFVGRWTYSPKEAPAVLRRYRTALIGAPRELTTMVVYTQTELRITALWTGSTRGAEAALAQYGKLGDVTSASLGEASFLELQRAVDERMAWGRRYYAKGGFVHEIDDATIAVLADCIADVPNPDSEIYLLQLGGAVCDVDESETPYSGRAAGHYWIVEGVWDDPALDSRCTAWGRKGAARLAANSLQTNYVNEQSETGKDLALNAYGEDKYNRLARLKSRYDPDNLFRLNQNIEPRPWSAPK